MGIIDVNPNASTPPGVLNTSATQLINTCRVHFPSGQLYNLSLPPINRVSLDEREGKLEINTFFLIDEALVEKHLQDLQFAVYQLYCISDAGEPEMQFYITSNYTNGKTDNYYSVQLNFELTDESLKATGVGVKDIKSVQTFLWNIDPRTSRGTVTTVLSAAG